MRGKKKEEREKNKRRNIGERKREKLKNCGNLRRWTLDLRCTPRDNWSLKCFL
jgi:hypothetical protein